MKLCKLLIGIAGSMILFLSGSLSAQNPFIQDQFTADPSARVFDGRVYVYPSHDILADESRGRIGWFCMEDYHVFSSSNLSDWTDHGIILSQNDVEWTNPNTYSMWAPDCIERNGKYYFYFPAIIQDTAIYGRGFSVGVAIADSPEGPYTVQRGPIINVRGIDPNPFIDKDGQAYLYWSLGNLYAARLKNNMVELDSEPVVLAELPEKGLKEGPYLFERNGIYYLTYPHVENKTERLEYAMGSHPMGPFKVTGVIMNESSSGCWTNHQSILEFEGQWYLFYHDNDLSPAFDKARSIRVDSLFFNEDGTIQKVTPTLRGVGVVKATEQIEIDRYSFRSDTTVMVAFLDTLDAFKGWKVILDHGDTWIRFNRVDFGSGKLPSVQVKALAPMGGNLQIRLNQANGPLLSQIEIPEGTGWKTVKSPVSDFLPGIHHLVVVSKDDHPVEIDWVRFIKD
jgi:hypothetical protein